MTRPSLFRDLSYAAAGELANREGRLLLVDVMADWCPPCREMDRTTWRSPEVETWVAERAVAVQVDSEDPAVESFQIRSIPTIMLFKDGVLLDRVSGARDVPELLGWLARAERGEKDPPPADDDIHGRIQQVDDFTENGKLDDATSGLAWIWEHALEVGPEWIGVRHSYVLERIAELVARHPPARVAFAEIRDRTEARMPVRQAVHDWLDLNRVLSDEARSLAWFDSVEESLPGPARGLRSLAELLERSDRWAQLGRLFPDPVAILDIHHDRLQEMRPHLDAETYQTIRGMIAAQITALIKGLEAAGRPTGSFVDRAQALELIPR